jgi:hypothetical protein
VSATPSNGNGTPPSIDNRLTKKAIVLPHPAKLHWSKIDDKKAEVITIDED